MKLYLVIKVGSDGEAYKLIHAFRKHMTIDSGKLEEAELEKDIQGRNKEPTKVVRKLYP